MEGAKSIGYMNTNECESEEQGRLNLLIWSMLCYRESDTEGFQKASRMLGERQDSMSEVITANTVQTPATHK